MDGGEARKGPAYLVFDVETIPDGELLRRVKYPEEGLSIPDAVERARTEALERSSGRSDFVPASFVYPVSVCVARVGADFTLESITCLDDPQFRPSEIVRGFWAGHEHYQAKLVSFNGRGFDLPVLELAAYRFGITARKHFTEKYGHRYRYGDAHLDLNDWLSNHGAYPITGGLNLLSKLLGKPGKMSMTGQDVWDLYKENKLREINDYCMYDVFDTYFVFLRSRLMTGAIDLNAEQRLVAQAKDWITGQIGEKPHLQHYLDNWGEWQPWV